MKLYGFTKKHFTHKFFDIIIERNQLVKGFKGIVENFYKFYRKMSSWFFLPLRENNILH